MGVKYTPKCQVGMSRKQYVTGLRAERPIEIRVAMSEAVRSGAIFFKTSSDGILTSDVVPSQFIISADDTEKKTNLYRRHEETAHSAHGSGGEVGVQELVKSYEAKSSKKLDPHLRPPQLARPLHHRFSQEK